MSDRLASTIRDARQIVHTKLLMSLARLSQIAFLSGLPIVITLLLLTADHSVSAQADIPLPPHPYPLTEAFGSESSFTITAPSKISIDNGWVKARVSGAGEQYAYREIPSFSGDVRITVRGQVNDWENNCAVHAGIGDGLKSGIDINYGFFGGGCLVQGALIDAAGVTLDHGTDGCRWIGPWLWVRRARPYEATLTITGDDVSLNVPGIGSVSGTKLYDGVYSMLYVGETGRTVSSNYCSVDIDTVTIEPLEGALIAISDLEATVIYPTQIDLAWSHDIANAAAIRIERAEEGREWQEIATLGADDTAYEDNRVTCGTTYQYRADIYTADGGHTGYSNVANAITPACISIFEEDWESGLRPSVWTSYGDPAPHVDPGTGPDGSNAFEPNGDGVFYSGIISNAPFDITSGLGVEFWLKGKGEFGQLFSSASVGLTSCTPDDDNEETCQRFEISIAGSTEAWRAVYGGSLWVDEQFTEDWTPLNDSWHNYRFQIKPDGFVDYYRDDELKFTSATPLDFTKYSLLYLIISGKSQNGDWHMDDLVITAPAPPDWYVKVVNPKNQPVANAFIYADGQLMGRTNQAGMIHTQALPEGLVLAAVSEAVTTPSQRDAHNGWAYTTYLTSLTRNADEILPFTVSESGEQRLVLGRDYPLVLFNLVVSVEWDATEEYLNQIARAVKLASDHLFDLTDGQMAFGHVNIYSNSQHWADADIQISTKNIVRPHAYIGGILQEDTSHVIRVGRGWNGRSGNEGDWDQPDGFRTLAHEFGHYGLYLYDEYVVYHFDSDGDFVGEDDAFCPVKTDEATDDESVRGSAMYDAYHTTELSARGVPELWSAACEETLHYQSTNSSTWETIVSAYADNDWPSRWRIISPIDRGTVLAGPTQIPSSLPQWPMVQVHQGEAPEPPRNLTVLNSEGRPVANAIVALYRQSGVEVIGQGLTDVNGKLKIYGAAIGDTLRAASFDGGWAGNIRVEEQTDLTLIMEPVTAVLARADEASAAQAIPHMRLIAEPSPDPDQIDLIFTLHNFGADTDLGVAISEPGNEVSRSPNMSYSPTTGIYSGQISFMATERGMGRVRVFGSMAGSRVRMQSTYRLQRVSNDRYREVYSNDGNLHLEIDTGSLPANEAYFVVMPPGAIPGPLPAGMTLLGDPYDVTASGALAALEKSALLTMHFDKYLLPKKTSPQNLGIYHWNPVDGEWDMVAADLNEEQATLTAAVTALGAYALLMPDAPNDSVDICAGCQIYLPLIHR